MLKLSITNKWKVALVALSFLIQGCKDVKYVSPQELSQAGQSSNQTQDPTPLTAPLVPSGFSLNAVSSTQIDLSWTDNSNNETGFKIEQATSVNGNYTTLEVTNANQTSYSAVALASGTVYFFRISAVNAAGSSSSISASASTLTAAPTTPNAPSGLILTVVSSSQIDLAWTDNSSDESGFRVQMATSANGNYSTLTTTNANVTSYSATGLSSGTTYYFRVSAVNAAGNSNSVSGSATTSSPAATTPSAPSGLILTVVSSSQIDLAWTDNSDNETGFRVQRATSFNGNYTTITSTSANATSYSATGLSSATTYYFRVLAINAAGSSNYVVGSATTLSSQSGTAPAAPSGLILTVVSSSQIDLAWTDNSDDETGFRVQRATSANGNYTTLTTTNANATSYSATGLSSGTTYYFRVSAVNSSGNSNSVSASATTSAPTPTIPNAASNLTATVVSSTQINLTWVDNSSNETGFKVERALSAGGVYTTLVTTNANTTSYSVTGLVAGTTYYFRVSAVNSAGASAFASTSATTSVAAPAAPSNLSASAVSSSQILLTWTDNSNNEASFRIERSTTFSGTYVFIGSAPANATSYSDTALPGGATYYYRVMSVNAGGTSAAAGPASATTQPPLTADLVFNGGELVLAGGQEKVATNLVLRYQADGNLVLYEPGGNALWSTNTPGRSCSTGCSAVFQADGNLVLYQNGQVYWASNSLGRSPRLNVTAVYPYMKITDTAYNLAVWLGSDMLSESFNFYRGDFILYPGAMRKNSYVSIIYNTDGNLAVYDSSGAVLWETDTHRVCNNCIAYFQTDGNLVLYEGPTPYWASGTNGMAQYMLVTSNSEGAMFLLDGSGNPIYPVY